MPNTYRCSDGTKVSKTTIDRNVRKAKEEVIQDQLNEHGFNFCEDCAENGYPENADDMELRILDCSHNISVDECQKTGRSELAWDKNNMRIRCRFHHRQKDKTNLKFK